MLVKISAKFQLDFKFYFIVYLHLLLLWPQEGHTTHQSHTYYTFPDSVLITYPLTAEVEYESERFSIGYLTGFAGSRREGLEKYTQ